MSTKYKAALNNLESLFVEISLDVKDAIKEVVEDNVDFSQSDIDFYIADSFNVNFTFTQILKDFTGADKIALKAHIDTERDRLLKEYKDYKSDNS